ncbi:hypothetical protein F5148DRAFT_1227094 [Russula earlei]|uniref:Uncharacterized protein n=1 Tax=Russula earlei TaxID=71964 RepID=A0ACC0U228_9AGAM|nr:hypothetical protein F5148DRAFT_1227094 [Russula earlei]
MATFTDHTAQHRALWNSKIELADVRSIPVVELAGSAAHSQKIAMERHRNVFLGWRVPCLGLTTVALLLGCHVSHPPAKITIERGSVLHFLAHWFFCVALMMTQVASSENNRTWTPQISVHLNITQV